MSTYTITDHIAGETYRVTDDKSDAAMAQAILAHYPDAPDEVAGVIGQLVDALARREYTQELESYLGVTVERRGPGQPEIGPVVKIKLPPETIARIDARRGALTRSAYLREIIATAVAD